MKTIIVTFVIICMTSLQVTGQNISKLFGANAKPRTYFKFSNTHDTITTMLFDESHFMLLSVNKRFGCIVKDNGQITHLIFGSDAESAPCPVCKDGSIVEVVPASLFYKMVKSRSGDMAIELVDMNQKNMGILLLKGEAKKLIVGYLSSTDEVMLEYVEPMVQEFLNNLECYTKV